MSEREPLSSTAPAPVSVISLVDYQPRGIVSRQIVKKQAGNVTLFAFDEHEELSEHTSELQSQR